MCCPTYNMFAEMNPSPFNLYTELRASERIDTSLAEYSRNPDALLLWCLRPLQRQIQSSSGWCTEHKQTKHVSQRTFNVLQSQPECYNTPPLKSVLFLLFLFLSSFSFLEIKAWERSRNGFSNNFPLIYLFIYCS